LPMLQYLSCLAATSLQHDFVELIYMANVFSNHLVPL